MAGVSSDRLNEAVMELRRLTNDQLFQSMERLCEVDGISGDAGAGGVAGAGAGALPAPGRCIAVRMA